MSIDPRKNTEIGHFLGIDYGKADVGLALADEETKIAFIYKTLKNDKNFPRNLAEIIERENVKTVVIGIPGYIYTNVETHCDASLRQLAENLKNLGVTIKYQNEMFTTKIAQAKLIEKGVKGIKRYDDQEAARIILQEYLDNN